jgi:hypothetical protein
VLAAGRHLRPQYAADRDLPSGPAAVAGRSLAAHQDHAAGDLRRRPAAGGRQPDLNTIIVSLSLSLSISIYAAIGSLVFLIAIHKLQYFLNARIIGGEINARAWEILVAMMVMDALFGIPGLIAAPIYYAYLKDELSARKLV